MKKLLLLMFVAASVGVQAAEGIVYLSAKVASLCPAEGAAYLADKVGSLRAVYTSQFRHYEAQCAALLAMEKLLIKFPDAADIGEVVAELRAMYRTRGVVGRARGDAIAVTASLLANFPGVADVSEIVAELRGISSDADFYVAGNAKIAIRKLLSTYPITDKELVAWVLGACGQEVKEQVIRCQEERGRFLSLLEPASVIGSAAIVGATEQETGVLKTLAHPRVGRTLAVAKVVDGDITKNPEPFAHAIAAFLHGPKSFEA